MLPATRGPFHWIRYFSPISGIFNGNYFSKSWPPCRFMCGVTPWGQRLRTLGTCLHDTAHIFLFCGLGMGWRVSPVGAEWVWWIIFNCRCSKQVMGSKNCYRKQVCTTELCELRHTKTGRNIFAAQVQNSRKAEHGICRTVSVLYSAGPVFVWQGSVTLFQAK